MKSRSYKFNTLLEVTWLDIVDNSAWMSPMVARMMKGVACKTVGYFLSQDEKVLRISSSIQVEEKERNCVVIPWGCIEKVFSLHKGVPSI